MFDFSTVFQYLFQTCILFRIYFRVHAHKQRGITFNDYALTTGCVFKIIPELWKNQP